MSEPTTGAHEAQQQVNEVYRAGAEVDRGGSAHEGNDAVAAGLVRDSGARPTASQQQVTVDLEDAGIGDGDTIQPPATMNDVAWLTRAYRTEAERESALRIIAALRAPAAPANQWTACGVEMPASGRTVLAHYVNALGNYRIVRAEWVPARSLEASGDEAEGFAVYDEATDTEYCPEGWYEAGDAFDEAPRITETVTHWMPLPAPPSATSQPAMVDLLASAVLRDVVAALWTLPGFTHSEPNSVAEDVRAYAASLAPAAPVVHQVGTEERYVWEVTCSRGAGKRRFTATAEVGWEYVESQDGPITWWDYGQPQRVREGEGATGMTWCVERRDLLTILTPEVSNG